MGGERVLVGYHMSCTGVHCAGPQASSSTAAGGRGGAGGRGWSGAVGTPLAVSKLEALCSPADPPPGAPPGPPLAPLQRFLACVYMKRALQRFVHQEEFVRIFFNGVASLEHIMQTVYRN